MSRIDVIKENGQFEQLLRIASSNSLLKDEYLIPDTHPDVQQILFIDANPTIVSKELVGEKYLIEGRVDYTVLYQAREDENLINSVNYSQKFTNYLDLTEGEHRVECEAECKIEHIDSKIMNERKISVESVINVDWELYKSTEFEFVKDIEGAEKVEVLKRVESINKLTANENVELTGKSMIRVGMDKPQIGKVLNCSTNIHKKEIKVLDGKVYIACYCKINVIYAAADSNAVICLSDDMYLAKEEEINGATIEMIPSVTFELANKELTLGEDDLGEVRIINTDISVGANVKVFSDEEIDVISDAYSPKILMDLRKDQYEIAGMKGTQSTEAIVKEVLTPNGSQPVPEQVLYSTATPISVNSKVENDKVISDGIVKVDVLYKTNDEETPIAHMQEELPFVAAIDMPGVKDGMKSLVKTNVENIDTSIESGNIAVKINLAVLAKTFFETTKEFISDVLEVEGDIPKKNASITIYIVDKGDKLWDLAKKYNTTMEEIKMLNSIEDEEEMEEGCKILIPGRAIF
ncbi:MAG: DUF3794 and LysM peptidoglycan-binding domain-containing protein [Clostridium sp.]